jgi:hypothetical protein
MTPVLEPTCAETLLAQQRRIAGLERGHSDDVAQHERDVGLIRWQQDRLAAAATEHDTLARRLDCALAALPPAWSATGG